MEDPPPQKSSVLNRVRIFEGADSSPSGKSQSASPQVNKNPLPRKPMYYSNRDASPVRSPSPINLYLKDRGGISGRFSSKTDPSGRVSPRVDLPLARSASPSADPPAQTKSNPSASAAVGCKLDAAWARQGRSTQREGDSARRGPSPARQQQQQKAMMRYSSLSPSARHRQTGGKNATAVGATEKKGPRSLSVPRQAKAASDPVAKKEFIDYAAGYRSKRDDNRSVSPLKAPKLQRHRWDQRNEPDDASGRRDVGTRANPDEKQHYPAKEAKPREHASSVASTPVSKNRAVAIFLNKGRRLDPKPVAEVAIKPEPTASSAIDRNWPKQRFDAKIQSYKLGATPSFPETSLSRSLSSTGSKDTRKETPSPTKLSRFPVKSYNPLAGVGSKELKKNLNAAATVMKEEKASSIGSSSSSSRSELSHEELSGIANKALNMSKMRGSNQANQDRRKKSPLGQMMSEKRTAKTSSSQAKPKSGVSVVSYGSAQRLSDRLTRAERFTALKKRQMAVSTEPPDDDFSIESSSFSPEKKNSHPVFGYAQQVSANRETTNSDLSLIRRSRNLSKGMQEKAGHHAASSPTYKQQSQAETKTGGFGGREYREQNFAPSSNRRPIYEKAGLEPKQAQTKTASKLDYTPPIKNFPVRTMKPSFAPAETTQRNRDQIKNQPSSQQPPPDGKSKYQFSHFHRHFQYPSGSNEPERQQPSVPDFNPNGRLGQESLDFLAFEKKLSHGTTPTYGTTPTGGHSTVNDQSNGARPGLHIKTNAFERKHWNDREGYGDRNGEIGRRPGELSISVSASTAESSEYFSGIGSVDDHSSDETGYLRQHVAAEVNDRYPSRYALQRGFQNRTRQTNSIPDISALSNLQHQSAARDPPSSAFKRHIPKKDPSVTQNESKEHLFSDFSESGAPNKTPVQNPGSFSSDGSSSGTTQDPLLWFHNKYGVGSPTKGTGANATTPNFSTRAKASPIKSKVVSKLDEDDDIFDGLDDETVLSKLAKSPAKRRQFMDAVKSQGTASPSQRSQKMKKMQGGTTSPRPAAQQRHEGLSPSNRPASGFSPSNRQQKAVQPKRIDEGPPSPEAKKERSPFKIITSQIETKEETAETSPSLSFLDSNILQDEKKSMGIRCNPDEMMPKAESESVSEADENEASLLDESIVEENEKPKAPSAVFVDLGVAFVNSIKNSLPENLPEVSTCAIDAKMRCVDRINGALGKFEEKESMCKDYEQKISVHDEDPAALDKLKDAERRIRVAWDRDSGKEDQSAIGDMLDDDNISTKSSSSTKDTETKERVQKARVEAQAKLFEHVDKAMQLVTNRTIDTGNSGNSDSTGPMPSAKVEKRAEELPMSPSSNLSAKLSFEQRNVLENFSTQLKNDGVEVLKLGRRNKWQVRYLTVSREVTSLEDDDNDEDIGHCPKALLWPKQRKPPSCSISSIKDNGRGGLLFDHLRQARIVDTNEHYKHVPKKLKDSFPQFAGIVLDYEYSGGGERQLYFCFKSKLEAQAFHAAVLIIKEATERGSKDEDSKIEARAS